MLSEIVSYISYIYKYMCRKTNTHVTTHDKYYEIEYQIGDTVYKMLQRRSRSPKKIYKATAVCDITNTYLDITSDIISYAGPNENFHHTQWLSPSLLYSGITSIVIDLFNGQKVIVQPSESISLCLNSAVSLPID